MDAKLADLTETFIVEHAGRIMADHEADGCTRAQLVFGGAKRECEFAYPEPQRLDTLICIADLTDEEAEELGMFLSRTKADLLGEFAFGQGCLVWAYTLLIANEKVHEAQMTAWAQHAEREVQYLDFLLGVARTPIPFGEKLAWIAFAGSREGNA